MRSEAESTDLHIDGEHTVGLPPRELWLSLNDAQILQQCIKGCDQVERVGDNEFCATFKLRVGPFRKSLRAKLNVIDEYPPSRYRLVSTMDAGIAGKLKGIADVTLDQQGINNTRLRYVARINADGWIGQLGVKVLGKTAEKYMHQFFKSLVASIEDRED